MSRSLAVFGEGRVGCALTILSARFAHSALPKEGEGEEGLLPSHAEKYSRPHRLSGSANTHSTEPPSGFRISVVSVARSRAWLDPFPVATATYCLPFTL